MGVVIFLLTCLVVVLIGFLIKYKNENDTENTTENATEVKEPSVGNGMVVIDSCKPFPKINYGIFSEYSKEAVQSVLTILLCIQADPIEYLLSFDDTSVYIKRLVYNEFYDYNYDGYIPIGLLTLLKSKNLISIQQTYTPAKHDDYGFVESDRKYKIIIKVTEEGKAYLNN